MPFINKSKFGFSNKIIRSKDTKLATKNWIIDIFTLSALIENLSINKIWKAKNKDPIKIKISPLFIENPSSTLTVNKYKPTRASIIEIAVFLETFLPIKIAKIGTMTT